MVEVSDKDGVSCASLIGDHIHDRKRVNVVVGEIFVLLTPIYGLFKQFENILAQGVTPPESGGYQLEVSV